MQGDGSLAIHARLGQLSPVLYSLIDRTNFRPAKSAGLQVREGCLQHQKLALKSRGSSLQRLHGWVLRWSIPRVCRARPLKCQTMIITGKSFCIVGCLHWLLIFNFYHMFYGGTRACLVGRTCDIMFKLDPGQ